MAGWNNEPRASYRYRSASLKTPILKHVAAQPRSFETIAKVHLNRPYTHRRINFIFPSGAASLHTSVRSCIPTASRHIPHSEHERSVDVPARIMLSKFDSIRMPTPLGDAYRRTGAEKIFSYHLSLEPCTKRGPGFATWIGPNLQYIDVSKVSQKYPKVSRGKKQRRRKEGEKKNPPRQKKEVSDPPLSQSANRIHLRNRNRGNLLQFQEPHNHH